MRIPAHTELTFLSFWGKARRGNGEIAAYHPAWAHGLDVAAVGHALLEAFPDRVGRAARLLGWSIADFGAIWVHLLALHDIGKFAPQFQIRVPELCPPVLEVDREALRGHDPGHPAAGLALLFASFDPMAPLDRPRPSFAGWSWKHAGPLLAPILGHHGRPVALPDRPWHEIFRPKVSAVAALDYWDCIARLIPAPDVPKPRVAALKTASWSIAGLTALADWIGSNKAWFPYIGDRTDVDAYWAEARRQARDAVAKAGLRPADRASRLSFEALTEIAHPPTDAQTWATEAPLPEGPLLAVIEDVTGGGKTEAALMLAHRLMAAGRATGIYFALPTMATANAMFTRLKNIAPRLFVEGGRFSLTLAHGAASLHPAYGARETMPGFTREPTADPDDSGRVASEWLMSENRKALLADIGVGTIDQALLAVLPTRYQAVRLVGLAGKVLVVDEAHAYDAYVARELDRLVAFHAAQGGSTMILSATLPKAVKRRLIAAWGTSLGIESDEPAGDLYPGATLVSASGAVETCLRARADLVRTMKMTRINDAAVAIERIAAAARAGAAVAWVRNTVDDAVEAVRLLRDADVASELFHARFAMQDRLAIEEAALARFGKHSAAADRQGRVLVATQVIEQSLDVDFDLIVSDLAPIDLLLQRAGRLWRHTRHERSVPGPELLIVSPDPDGAIAADWIRARLPGTAVVYTDHAVLWRSARAVARQPRFRTPEDVRVAVEAVYAEDAADIPEALKPARDQARGEDMAARAFADANLLAVETGYQAGVQGWVNETAAATRLGEEMRTLRLARLVGDRLVPYADDPDPKRAWALSEVRAYERRLKGKFLPPPEFEALAREAREGWSKFEDDVVLLVLESSDEGALAGRLLDEHGASLNIAYSLAYGLSIG